LLQASAIPTFLALLAFLVPAPNSLATSIDEGYDCVYYNDLSPPVAKDSAGNEITLTNASKLVIIFSTFSNPCGQEQQVLVVTEVRNQNNATAFWKNAVIEAGAFNSSDVGVLWYPKEAGTYEPRSFAISNSTESQVPTDVQTRELVVIDYELKSV
jgi:hypothetical protein